MADSAIFDLNEATEIYPNDLFVLEQSGEAKKLPGSKLTEFIDRSVLNVSVSYVPATSSGSASYNAETGVLTLNIPKGAGVSGLQYVSTDGLTDLYHLNYEDGGTPTNVYITNGSSIQSITRTATGGGANHNVDTYTITLTNGNTSTFTVTNGLDGSGTVSKVANISPTSGNIPAADLAAALLPNLRIVETNKALSSISWTSDATYTDYPYYTDVSVTGVTANHFAEVVFAPADVGDFAPVCQTGSGTVRIWCNSNTRDSLTIPTIFAWR